MKLAPWHLDNLIELLQGLNYSLQYFLFSYFFTMTGAALVAILICLGVWQMYKHQKRWRRGLGLTIVFVGLGIAVSSYIAAKNITQERLQALDSANYEVKKAAVKTFIIDGLPLPIDQAWWLFHNTEFEFALQCKQTSKSLWVAGDDIFKILIRERLEESCARIAKDLGIDSEWLIEQLTDTKNQMLLPSGSQIRIIEVKYVNRDNKEFSLEQYPAEQRRPLIDFDAPKLLTPDPLGQNPIPLPLVTP
ncbi:MAG: hypothetical protein WC668_01055 [Patescibacteria group bacterium]|jgi:hypothetical protein